MMIGTDSSSGADFDKYHDLRKVQKRPVHCNVRKAVTGFNDYTAQQESAPEIYDEIFQRLEWAQEVLFPEIRGSHSSHAAASIASYARRHRILKTDTFQPGTIVMVRDPAHRDKMQLVYKGPFKIMRRTKGG